MIGHGMRIAGADDQCSVPGVTKNVSQQESGECRVSSVSTVSTVQRGDKNCPTAGGDICNNARGMGLGPVAPDGDYQMEVYLVLSCPIKYEGSAELPTFSISLQDAVSCTTTTNIGLS